MQLDGVVSRPKICPPPAILPNASLMQSCPVNTGGELFDRCRILWCRPATPWSGSSYCYVEQTLDALWMRHSNREIHENIIFPILSWTRALVPTNARIVPKVQYPHHSFVDEDVMGKKLMFELHTVVADTPLWFSREGDKFLMQVLIKAGYRGDALRQLNQVQISLQVLFLSDVLTTSGGKVSSDILLRRPQGEARSNMRWLNKQPTNSDMRFWNHAIISMCPTRSSTLSIGEYICNLHRVRRWF